MTKRDGLRIPSENFFQPESLDTPQVCEEQRRRTKGLKIISKCPFSPSGNAGERRNALFPRACSPPIASLPALQVRHDDDVHDAEYYACGEQGEFDSHIREYTTSALQAG